MFDFLKGRDQHVDINSLSRKEIGTLGERIAAQYVERHGMRVIDHNVSRKTGELDLVALEPAGADGEGTLHFIEVKTIVANRFPKEEDPDDIYDPSLNLHEAKLRHVARTGEWYVLEKKWEGEWQIDGCLVWLRRSDGAARVSYLPQIV